MPVTITFTIPDAKVADAEARFLSVMPNPVGSGMTDRQWIKNRIKKWFNSVCSAGKARLDAGDPDGTDYLPND